MIIFLYGEDTYRSRQKLNELKLKFIKDVDAGGNNIKLINGETAGLGEINEAFAAQSLFVSKQMVVIENVLKGKKLQKSLLEMLEKKETDNIVIFYDEHSGEKLSVNKFFKFLSKQKFVQQFKKLSNIETANWIKKTVLERGGKISLRAANCLAGLVGSDLWQISNEIDKLISYKKAQNPELIEDAGQAEINDKDITEMVRGKFAENIFALTDAISQKNKQVSIDLLEKELDNGLAEAYLMHMLIRQFRILLQIRQAIDLGHTARKAASELKLHPFVAQKSFTQARNFSMEILKKIFSRLIKLDRQLKTGQGDLKTELVLMIAKI
ncbi:DNA polymerase III subunit delta [Candidatus Parcubacteria bacterium]|nr:DNA polymerase III subunit delta [Candidatus Parcubacteria bacterium]